MLLQVKDVTKIYKRAGLEFKAVDSADFVVDSSEFAIINGQSGSGKSTLLAIIAGLLFPESGKVFFEDVDITQLNDRQLSRLRNEKIGFIPQGHCLLDNFTVIDNVCLPYYLKKLNGDPYKVAIQLLERIGIAHLANQYPVQLSGGELRRAAIARGLINSPKLIIADEPTSDLDPINSANIMTLFEEIARSGSAVLVVTHEFQKPIGCNKHLTMENGRIRNKI
ncbi:MAG: ABC transporter ATP-binding protein [Fusobacteriaceae bacterium]|jgi:putative ABC transport system ATP-binding protein|nr:ABC transporter ATP-binding protein [Fusobacteriaceae bacterium]